MDVVRIVGTKKVSFEGQRGDMVEGMSFYYEQPFSERAEDAEGVRVGTFFLSARALGGLHHLPRLGDEIELVWSRYGKVTDCKLADYA